MTGDYSTDVVIVGAGPVGLFSVFECGMLKLDCHVVDALSEIVDQAQSAGIDVGEWEKVYVDQSQITADKMTQAEVRRAQGHIPF